MSDPADINDRLEAAAEKAEAGSQIIHDFANGDEETEVQTESGPLPTLAKLTKYLNEDLGGVVESVVAEQSSVLPESDKMVRGDASGKIDPNWLPDDVQQAAVSIGGIIAANERLIFKKKKILSLPLKHPEYDWLLANKNIKFYPQTFCLDEDTGKLFVVDGGQATRTILVYNWPTGEFDRMFFCTGGGLVTEGAVIKSYGSVKYLHMRTTGDKLGRWDITNLPSARAEIAITDVINVTCGLNFMYLNGVWTFSDTQPGNLGNQRSRGKFLRTNDNFETIGSIDCGQTLMGIYAGLSGETAISKTQGVTDSGYGLLSHMGGQQVATAADSQYGQIGLRAFTYDGVLVGDGLMSPEKFRARCTDAWGLTPSLTEAEGVVTTRKGEVISLTITADWGEPDIFKDEGMLFLQEYAWDGVDFSDCAVSRNGSMRSYGQLTSTSDGAKLLNPITGAAITTLVQLFEAMIQTGTRYWETYSTLINLLHVDGVTTFPNGGQVSVRMYRSDIFYVEFAGFNAYARWRVYLSGGVWIQQQTGEVFHAQTYYVAPPNIGDMTFRMESNTKMSIAVKGSDGVVRFGSITLS